jgi:hypothetical protein
MIHLLFVCNGWDTIVLEQTLPGRQPSNVTRLRSCRFEYPVKKWPRRWDEMHARTAVSNQSNQSQKQNFTAVARGSTRMSTQRRERSLISSVFLRALCG